MEEAYKIAKGEHLAQIEEEMHEIEALASTNNLSALAYRAAERNLQLLIEACIGIAKQVLKANDFQVHIDAREVFSKLKIRGLDPGHADWNRIIGMRNALVHDYLNIQPERIKEVIRNKQFKVLFEFAKYHLQ
jgi:uncharacterized protein YutE (UPF0331/DUF86 family)